MEDTRRARRCDPRLHRDLAQHTQTPQRPEHAHTQRIREPTPTTRDRRLIPNTRLQETQARSRSPWNSGRLSTQPAISPCFGLFLLRASHPYSPRIGLNGATFAFLRTQNDLWAILGSKPRPDLSTGEKRPVSCPQVL